MVSKVDLIPLFRENKENKRKRSPQTARVQAVRESLGAVQQGDLLKARAAIEAETQWLC